MIKKLRIRILESLQRVAGHTIGSIPIKHSPVAREHPLPDVRINEIMSSGFGIDVSNPRKAPAMEHGASALASYNWAENVYTRGPVYYED